MRRTLRGSMSAPTGPFSEYAPTVATIKPGFAEPPGDSKANALQHLIPAACQPRSGFVFRWPLSDILPAPRHASRRRSPGGGGAECTVVQTAVAPRKWRLRADVAEQDRRIFGRRH